jgi:hypothetical protein
MNRKEICDTLCEVLVNQFTGETSLQVIDCYNFFVIKGYTISNNILDLSEPISDFEKKNKLSKINIIDLIVYNTKKDTESSDIPSYFSVSSDVKSN